MMVPLEIANRRTISDEKLEAIRRELVSVGAETITGNGACVYATGSVGRREMSSRSDLDIFIIKDKDEKPELTNLEEIRLKARLIEVGRKLGFPEFSEDGVYVRSYDLHSDLLQKIGTRHDDYDNVFTARLLLLLESCPILGSATYSRAIDNLIAAYWRDYPQNSDRFLPVFLLNDILRFWKTLCLNYEERTKAGKEGKRRLYNYKLKYSRLLTCYSAVVYLLAVLKSHRNTVSIDAAKEMVALTPTSRLEDVARIVPSSTARISTILEQYAGFLTTCDEDKQSLMTKFEEPKFKAERLAEAKKFGESIFELTMELGHGTELLRYLVV